ncbi:MAG TPA: hypothetical protein VIC60_10045 [Thermomicrobiales bacterium]
MLKRVTGMTFVILLSLFGGGALQAASGFAVPQFQTQWNSGEALAPNFWGPLATAKERTNEPYVEALGGQRVVQYFDKARMELTATGTVTNGLLARELILGSVQTGDDAFQKGTPAAIPVAGDLDNLGPTYAMIGANSATLMVETASTEGDQPTLSLSATGALGLYKGNYFSDPFVVMSHPDATTHHNIPKAFCDFRARVGLSSIGYAIAEPFWSTVKVGGIQKDVLIQPFQRRVLTYTPTNNDPFKVEFSNIGQHYYQWRYGQ